jgi:hypothetical protein
VVGKERLWVMLWRREGIYEEERPVAATSSKRSYYKNKKK